MVLVPESFNKQRPRGGGRGRGPLWLWLLGGAVALVVLVVALVRAFPETAGDGFVQVDLVWSVVLLVVLGGSLIVHVRARPGQAARHAAVWIALAAVLLLGYSFRHEFAMVKDRLVGELLPHKGVPGDGTISLSARQGGHFVAEALVDGVAIRFLVDTGASDVVLSPSDAERLGFDLKRLDFNRPYATANGVVWGAPVKLGRVAIGPVALENIAASVNGADLRNSLLGMSFLGRLSGYSVDGGRLTLKQ
jgi:aspartyl protease family protein